MGPTAGLCPPQTYAALTNLATSVPPDQAIVELGTYKGHGTMALIEGAKTGVPVFTVDTHDMPGQRYSTAVGPSRDRLNFSDPSIRIEATRRIGGKAEMIQGDSQIIGTTWAGPPVGMLVIDADHREGAVRRDFAAWETHLAKWAWVCFDDYHPVRYPGVVRVVTRLVNKGILTLEQVHGTLAIAVKR